MNDNFSWLSSSNEIEVIGELNNSIVDLDFKNNKGTNESYVSAYFLSCSESHPLIVYEAIYRLQQL